MSMNPATGEVLKMARLTGAPGAYFSSPVVGDGKVFMVSNECKVAVVRPSAQWEMLGVNELNDECHHTRLRLLS